MAQTVDNFLDIPISRPPVDQVQPMTGLVFWPNNVFIQDKRLTIKHTKLLFMYLNWNDVLDSNNRFDFSKLDQELAEIASSGRQVVLRISYFNPGKAPLNDCQVPAHIRNQPGYNDIKGKWGQTPVTLPNWSFTGSSPKDNSLPKFTLDFFEAFADRYDNSKAGNPIAFLQVGFGSWSEYHLYGIVCDGGLDKKVHCLPTQAFQEKFLAKLEKWFEVLNWSVSIDAKEHQVCNSPFHDKPDFKKLKFGLFDDSFMKQGFLTANGSLNPNDINVLRWRFFQKIGGQLRNHVAPSGGEFAFAGTPAVQTLALKPNGPFGKSFEWFSKLYGITYILANGQTNYVDTQISLDRIRTAGLATGYRFEVTSYQYNQATNLSLVEITNNGVAPIYYKAYPTIDGTGPEDDTATLKGLIPGASRTFEIRQAANDSLKLICDHVPTASKQIQFEANLH